MVWTFEEDRKWHDSKNDAQWNAEGMRRKRMLREQWMVGIKRNIFSKHLTEEDAKEREL